jgi:hypothetical protein
MKTVNVWKVDSDESLPFATFNNSYVMESMNAFVIWRYGNPEGNINIAKNDEIIAYFPLKNFYITLSE